MNAFFVKGTTSRFNSDNERNPGKFACERRKRIAYGPDERAEWQKPVGQVFRPKKLVVLEYDPRSRLGCPPLLSSMLKPQTVENAAAAVVVFAAGYLIRSRSSRSRSGEHEPIGTGIASLDSNDSIAKQVFLILKTLKKERKNNLTGWAEVWERSRTRT